MGQIKIRINSLEEFKKLMHILSSSQTTYKWNSDSKPEEYTPKCAKCCSKRQPIGINLRSFDSDIHRISFNYSEITDEYIPLSSFLNKLQLETEESLTQVILPEIK